MRGTTTMLILVAMAGSTAGAQEFWKEQPFQNEWELHRPTQGLEYEYEWDDNANRWVLDDVESEQYEHEPGEGYHEQEWYDPSDWFEFGRDVDHEDRDEWQRWTADVGGGQTGGGAVAFDDDDEGWEWEALEGEWEYEDGDYEYEFDPESGVLTVQRDRDFLPDEDVGSYRWDGQRGSAPPPISSGRIPAPPTTRPQGTLQRWRQDVGDRIAGARGDQPTRESRWEWETLEGEWEYETSEYEYEYDPESGVFSVERRRTLLPDEDIAEYRWDGQRQTAPPPIRSGRVPPPPMRSPRGDGVWGDGGGQGIWGDRDQPRQQDDTRGWEWEALQSEWEYEANDLEYEYDPYRGVFEVERDRTLLPDEDVEEYFWQPPEGTPPPAIREGRIPPPPNTVRGDGRMSERRQGAAQQSQRDRQSQGELSGEVVGLERIRASDGRPEAVRLRVRTEDGRERALQLGDARHVGERMPRIQRGDRVMIGGEMAEAGGRRVFHAEEIRTREGRYQIPEYRYDRRIEGRLEGLRTVAMSEGEPEGVVARVRTREGRTMDVLLGPRDALGGEVQRLRQGATIQVEGFEREADGRRTFVVQEIRVSEGGQGQNQFQNQNQGQSQSRPDMRRR